MRVYDYHIAASIKTLAPFERVCVRVNKAREYIRKE